MASAERCAAKTRLCGLSWPGRLSRFFRFCTSPRSATYFASAHLACSKSFWQREQARPAYFCWSCSISEALDLKEPEDARRSPCHAGTWSRDRRGEAVGVAFGKVEGEKDRSRCDAKAV